MVGFGPDFKAQELTNLWWAWAKLEHDPGRELSERATVTAARLAPSMEPQNLANMLWAWAKLEYTPHPDALWSFLAVRARARRAQGRGGLGRHEWGEAVAWRIQHFATRPVSSECVCFQFPARSCASRATRRVYHAKEACGRGVTSAGGAEAVVHPDVQLTERGELPVRRGAHRDQPQRRRPPPPPTSPPGAGGGESPARFPQCRSGVVCMLLRALWWGDECGPELRPRRGSHSYASLTLIRVTRSVKQVGGVSFIHHSRRADLPF